MCTYLHKIELFTDNSVELDCEYLKPPLSGIGLTISSEYVDCSVKIYDKQDSVIYESCGEGDLENHGAMVKLRGNVSAFSEKKSYKIKLNQKYDLLQDVIGRTGKQYKNKNWVLLANARNLNFPVAQQLSSDIGLEWQPEYSFVELYVNGDYKGVYILSECIDDARVSRMLYGQKDVYDYGGFIIEKDSYWWNEDEYIKTPLRNCYTLKAPKSINEYVKTFVNNFEHSFLDDTYDDYLDMDSYVKFILLHDYIGTKDGSGSNIYMEKMDSTSSTKMKFFMAWDFDDAFQKHDLSDTRKDCYANLTKTSVFRDKYSCLFSSVVGDIPYSIGSFLSSIEYNELNNAWHNEEYRWNVSIGSFECQKVKMIDWIDKQANVIREYVENRK